jgi:DNA gyrase subunit A
MPQEFEELPLANNKDEVVGMIAVDDMDSNILVVSENGYGKRSSLDDYRITNRGGKRGENHFYY